ncbi:hypothetical protein [Streptomyces sp. AGS-58]|uniref:hypothetical protein n=1 Tax=unclassified Streptomyces TaxID=2593676 RepID=UPI0035A2F736
MTTRYAWWGVQERAKKMDRSVAPFEKKYPEARGRTGFQTYESFWEKSQARAASGNPPDFFQSTVTFLRKYDKRGILVDSRS